MLNQEQVRDIEDYVLNCYERAQKVFNRTFELPKLEFNLKGIVAGNANVTRNIIRLHPAFYLKYGDIYKQTILHECCHLFSDIRFGQETGHGPLWKQTMREMGAVRLSRCHSYDTSGLRNAKTRYVWKCHCGEMISITSIIFNRMKNDIFYRCRKCHTRLVPANFGRVTI